MDTIIRNGRVIDGTGNSWFKADIGILNGKIKMIGNLKGIQAASEINAEGKYVAPGFIDLHQHSDITILAAPSAESELYQGITTIINGNCGHSACPVQDKELLKSHLYGFQPEWNIEINWTSVEEYMERLKASKPAVNVGVMVGHGAIRLAVMGFSNRYCTQEELRKMKGLLIECLEQGAIGFSTGLEYSPGRNANSDELFELVKVAADMDRLYATHIRERGFKFQESLEEAINTSRVTGAKMQLSHMTPKFWAPGNYNEKVIELIENARAEGMDVACDVYPYTYAAATLGHFLPPWAYTDHSKGILGLLNDKEARKEMKKYDNHGLAYLAQPGKWENLILCTSRSNSNLVGKNIAEIADMRGLEDPYDAVFDLLLEEGSNFYNVLVCAIVKKEEDIEEMLKYRNTIVMSDSYNLSKKGVLKGTVMGPAAYSWTVHYLTHYIRKRNIISLEEGIRRITSFPAQRFGIHDRGLIKPGMWADVVIFDFQELEDNASLKNPNQYPSGIEHVFVNGGHIIKNGKHTNKRFGSVLSAK